MPTLLGGTNRNTFSGCIDKVYLEILIVYILLIKAHHFTKWCKKYGKTEVTQHHVGINNIFFFLAGGLILCVLKFVFIRSCIKPFGLWTRNNGSTQINYYIKGNWHFIFSHISTPNWSPLVRMGDIQRCPIVWTGVLDDIYVLTKVKFLITYSPISAYLIQNLLI